jgi:hypothetical protein
MFFGERSGLFVPLPERDPSKNYKRNAGCRKPMSPRQVFKATDFKKKFLGFRLCILLFSRSYSIDNHKSYIMYILRSGPQWKGLPERQFGRASAIYAHFMYCGGPDSLALCGALELLGTMEWKVSLRDRQGMDGSVCPCRFISLKFVRPYHLAP